jgi:hypothetical protein
MNGENIITIRLDNEFFATQGELAYFVAGKLKAALDFWPERTRERERSVNLNKVVPGIAVMYEVNYFPTRFAYET